MSRRITYIGVIRFNDRVAVASYSPNDNDDASIIKQVLAKPSTFVEPRRRYTNEGDMLSIHFTADERNRVYACVTDKEYPPRVAFSMLEEVESKFLSKVGDKSLTAKEAGLSRTVRSSFQDICIKYDDVSNVDRLASVQAKVDIVKSTMADNIEQMLVNSEKLEHIQSNAENLNEQAAVFKNRSTQLRRQMKCKAMKMWLLLALVIMIALIIIIVPLVIMSKNSK